MSNTFVTPSAVVRDAALFLNDSLLLGNLVNRNVEQTFATKVGSTVKVKGVPNLGTADELTSTTSATNVVESGTDVTIEKHFYKRVDITSDEALLSVDDFNQQITLPAVRALIRGTESYFLQKIVGGFNRNIVGTAGASPSTHAHILAAEKKIFDNRGDNSQLVGVISSTAHASFAALNVFTSMDYGAERPAGLRSNSLGMMSGINWFRTPNAGSLTLGDTAGTVLVDGTVASGTTIHIDGFTSATGTIAEGTRFVIENDATVYTVTAKATIANNECDITIYPTLAAQADDGETITFQTAPTTNVVYNPLGVAAAILPGPAMGPQTAVANVNGLGIRIISDISTSTLTGTWVFDLYAACKVVMPEFGAVLQG